MAYIYDPYACHLPNSPQLKSLIFHVIADNLWLYGVLLIQTFEDNSENFFLFNESIHITLLWSEEQNY